MMSRFENVFVGLSLLKLFFVWLMLFVEGCFFDKFRGVGRFNVFISVVFL